MSIKTLCCDLCDFWIKSKRVMSENVFDISRPPGGAIKSRCVNCRAKVFPWPLGSVHTKFNADRYWRQKNKKVVLM